MKYNIAIITNSAFYSDWEFYDIICGNIESVFENRIFIIPGILIIINELNLSLEDIYGLQIAEQMYSIKIKYLKYKDGDFLNFKHGDIIMDISIDLCEKYGYFWDEPFNNNGFNYHALYVMHSNYKVSYFYEKKCGVFDRIVNIIFTIVELLNVSHEHDIVYEYCNDEFHKIREYFEYSKISLLGNGEPKKYKLNNLFDFNISKMVVGIGDSQLKNIIKFDYSELFYCDNFILNLYVLHYELWLPIEMTIIIFGYL